MQDITDLQNQLAGPDGMAIRKQLQQRLQAQASMLHRTMQRGLPAEKFTTAKTLESAIDAALRVLQRSPSLHNR